MRLTPGIQPHAACSLLKTPCHAGPGFSLSIAGGGCVFNDTAFSNGSGDIEIDCVGPSVTVKKTPAVFVSKSNTPETFISSVSTLVLAAARCMVRRCQTGPCVCMHGATVP